MASYNRRLDLLGELELRKSRTTRLTAIHALSIVFVWKAILSRILVFVKSEEHIFSQNVNPVSSWPQYTYSFIENSKNILIKQYSILCENILTKQYSLLCEKGRGPWCPPPKRWEGKSILGIYWGELFFALKWGEVYMGGTAFMYM